MTKKIKKIGFILTIFSLITLLSGNEVFAQKGSTEKGIIEGKVVDEKTGDPLIGARIMIKGTKRGGLSKYDGSYIIRKVDAGEYTLQFTYVGYSKAEVTNVVVKAGKTTKIDLSLKEESITSDEVVVTAKRVQETGAALLKERQKAESVSDAIGAEEISRSGGSDAADAIKQVTGATTVGGKYVFIRGLGDRYSSTQLNGANLPSADPDKKAVHLDLFPTNLIENITTIKTATPDKPGDFTGGTVDIKTKSFPDKFRMGFSASSSYNTNTTGADMLSYAGGGTDWLAIEDGTRDVPSDIRNADIPSITDARRDRDAAMKLDRLSNAFNPLFAPTNEIAPVNGGFSFNVGDNMMDGKLGYLASLSYGRNYKSYDNGKIANYSQPGTESKELDAEYDATQVEGIYEVAWGAMANMAYNFDQNNDISFNFIYNRSGESKSVYQDGYRRYYGIDMETRILSYIERSISSYQLAGEHNFASMLGSKLDWQVSLSDNMQNQPDFRTFDNVYEWEEDEEGNMYKKYKLNTSDNNAVPSRYYRDLTEDLYGAKWNLEIPLKDVFDTPLDFKTGMLFNMKDRSFAESRYVFEQDRQTYSLKYNGDPNSFMADSTGLRDWASQGAFNYFGNYLVDWTSPAGSYTGEQTIMAGYGMIDWYATDEFRVVGGVRYETTDIETISKDTTKAKGIIDEQDVLPSVNLTYMLTEKMNIRAAYGKTIARPTFREIAPYNSEMPIEHKKFLGNPDLERTIIDNMDLRWEWFVNPGEILSVGGFYKRMENPIELAYVNANNNIQPKNVDEAIIYGLEFEFRKQLDFVDFLKDVSFGMNLTLVQSQVDIPEFELLQRRAFDENAESTRELQGQSPYIVNLDLSYANYESGTDANIHFNVFGKRLSEVGDGSPDYYEYPKPDLNIVFSQKFFDNFKAKLSVKNVLDAKNYKAVEFLGREYVSEQYLLGRTISLSLSYSLN